MMKLKSAGLALAIAIALPGAVQAEPLKVLTAGAFKQVLLAAKGVADIDPASGGSSGIYVASLIDTLGMGATDTKEKPSAQALIDLVRSNAGAAAIKSTGMEPIEQNPPAR
ncbi:hypothetical protein [Bradyrhizobium sp.]|jgi:hypothetical protein|uniref:hypothetical protein n=1 Tax=Bradyrhizobium sp. TaxID=376 RepID=UPI002E06A274|nr:hypothetical protein [Bradyrhizobium sp.]